MIDKKMMVLHFIENMYLLIKFPLSPVEHGEQKAYSTGDSVEEVSCNGVLEGCQVYGGKKATKFKDHHSGALLYYQQFQPEFKE